MVTIKVEKQLKRKVAPKPSKAILGLQNSLTKMRRARINFLKVKTRF